MNKPFAAVGCFFIAIAAFLYASKHITAAIMSSYINTPEVTYFEGAHQLIGFGMNFWIFASFLAGVCFFLVGIWPSVQRLNQTRNSKNSMGKDLN
ncbi:hypothetical protein RRV45_20080 [Bacillus sp. DTU_2020_1000418_1_SI_GHA_SEK_038]|uniref:hypothetical protein n=1 Tax=Bacillus sp. DTU_2020_1000418_1_SI_GHA_SEK_038 TaxID=3077585 RepID=UPI0028E93537|nr:hypothetical protein [Bacillus sp. DTU_2020_1000418_1_SI_GHA_SEK_038]WNS75149.1 hypothetical protein RRV45_20080 [Bacillus sp. DTU_2020_1000418_1_SI_GHA_SEK_038]